MELLKIYVSTYRSHLGDKFFMVQTRAQIRFLVALKYVYIKFQNDFEHIKFSTVIYKVSAICY